MRILRDLLVIWLLSAALGGAIWLIETPHPALWAAVGDFLTAHPIVSFATAFTALLGFMALAGSV